MAVRIFKYRGRTLEELQKMDMKELTGLFNASARRKIARGFTDAEKTFLKTLEKEKRSYKTHCRDMIIFPNMVGKRIAIHGGKEFTELEIAPEMIGHRFGEFVLTRKRVGHNAPGIGATRSSAAMSVK
jgi:small subunit ribosomal protein S19